ncbi:MAG: universal stress protein [Bradymonadaceae bacterium]
MKIAIATDLSKGAVTAAVWGFGHARRLREAGEDVELTLLHSIHSRYPQIVDTAARLDDPGTRNQLDEEVRKWVGTNIGANDLDYEVHSLQGPARDQIPGYVRQNDVDWLAIGATGRGSLEKLVVGSTSEAIAHDPPCRMSICHPGHSDWSDDPSIQVAIDFSDPSERALDTAISLARTYGAELDVFHVVQPPTHGGFPHDVYEGTELEGVQDLIEMAREELDSTLEARSGELESIDWSREVVSGYPTREIVDRAESEDHDGVVLGSVGRSAFGDFLIGSVARGVVKHLPTSVILAPEE